MRPVSEYSAQIVGSSLIPPALYLKKAHEVARGRATSRADHDERVTQAVDAVLAEGGHDALLLGAADPASRALREEFAARVDALLRTRLRVDSSSGSLLEDQIALELDARFPTLTEELQAQLEHFENDWGYARYLWGALALPGLSHTATTLLSVTRRTDWPAARLHDGTPTGLSAKDDSALLRVPHHISVHRWSDQHLVELWMWPQEGGSDSGWSHVWLLLQNEARLVPARTAETAPGALAPGLLDDAARLAVAAVAWHEVLEQRHLTVAGPYARDGMPTLPELHRP